MSPEAQAAEHVVHGFQQPTVYPGQMVYYKAGHDTDEWLPFRIIKVHNAGHGSIYGYVWGDTRNSNFEKDNVLHENDPLLQDPWEYARLTQQGTEGGIWKFPPWQQSAEGYVERLALRMYELEQALEDLKGRKSK